MNHNISIPNLQAINALAYEKTNFDEVLKAFYERNGKTLDEKGEWTVDMLNVANSQFKGWVKARLPMETIEEIILPWHKHFDLTLVPKEGLTVRLAAERWLSNTDYAQQNPACAATMQYCLRNLPKKIILAQKSLQHDVFAYLKDYPGHLYHIDGLHTLIATILRKETDIDFYIAVNKDFEKRIKLYKK